MNSRRRAVIIAITITKTIFLKRYKDINTTQLEKKLIEMANIAPMFYYLKFKKIFINVWIFKLKYSWFNSEFKSGAFFARKLITVGMVFIIFMPMSCLNLIDFFILLYSRSANKIN